MKPTCKRGHKRNEKNTRYLTNSSGYKTFICRVCSSLREKYYRKKRRDAGVQKFYSSTPPLDSTPKKEVRQEYIPYSVSGVKPPRMMKEIDTSGIPDDGAQIELEPVKIRKCNRCGGKTSPTSYYHCDACITRQEKYSSSVLDDDSIYNLY